MNPPATDPRRSKQATLIALVGASVALGILDAALALPAGDSGGRLALTFGGNIALLLIGFRWLQLDAAELDIRRPLWLNIAIVLLAAVFVPYYLHKTRPAGHRLQAIAGFFGIVFACMIGSASGALLMQWLAGAAAAP